MNNRYNMVDIGFNKLEHDEKRYFFMVMDIMMKRLHDNNLIVTSFNPKDIYYEDGEFVFDKIEKISPVNSSSKDEAIRNNIENLSNLAFCCYLPAYDLNNGLLSMSVVSEQFNNFKSIFNSVDGNYYQSILVDGYRNKKLPEVPYYYDYVSSHTKEAGGKGSSLVRATEFGKAMTDKENQEAAFGNIFFLVSLVAMVLVIIAGEILYLFG